jgi:hypothetical protein
MRRTPLIVLVLLLLSAATIRADTLEENERAELRRYLADLKAGRPGSAAQVDRLAGLPFAGLREVMQAYADLPASAEPHTHRAFHVLLERVSREALSPWPMLTLYSEDFAQFLTRPIDKEPLAPKLFAQLLHSNGGRQALDLTVRLTPEAGLRYLATNKPEGRKDLLDAWNRRLARGRERRPIHDLDRLLPQIAKHFALTLPADELESSLRFLASWPALRSEYQAALKQCLQSETPEVVLAGLTVQRQMPALMEMNEKLVEKFAANPKIVEQALRNYAFDEKTDHSATLRRLWGRLPAEQAKGRYACLYAMGIHPRGNDAIALEAVKEQAHDFIDVAMPVLKQGDRDKAREAVRHVLGTMRGHEEALRLARDLKLRGFEDDALRIALDGQREQIVRQSALLYLQLADGKTRRRVLSFLTHPKADLRLTAIRTFAEPEGLTAEDRNEIGPALIRIALSDTSMGHRQEAIYAIGCWRAKLALEFFRQILVENPPITLERGQFNNDVHYWQYRFRLMGLLGMLKLGDSDARKELLMLHARGGPAERMDVLLAFLDVGEVPEAAFADLKSPEPKLVATAARLIANHGDATARERMRKLFRQAPLWREFRDSGIDDHTILRTVGLTADE